MFDDFDTQIQSDEFAWRYEAQIECEQESPNEQESENETETREARQEDIQEEG